VENIIPFPQTVPGGGEEAVRLAKARDLTVWTRWHDTYYPVLYRYAYVRLANATDAEDVASQVFLEALEGINRYQYRGQPILAWFYGIARNLVAKRYRQNSRTAPLDGDYEDALNQFEANCDDRIAIYGALDQLKPEHSEVLILRYLLDLPIKEVASMIAKSEEATYSLQVRALIAMRARLDDDVRSAA